MTAAAIVCWIPVALLFVILVGDTLHLLLHLCDSSKVGALQTIAYLHTSHHRLVGAFGDVDRSHELANLVLDNFAKNYLKLLLVWLSWTALTIPAKGRAPPAGSRRAMALLIGVDIIRTLVSAALWLRFPPDQNIDHPSLKDPLLLALVQEAEQDADPSQLLLHGLFTSGPSHALHHHDWGNYPFQYCDWRAVLGLHIEVNYPSL
jgi:hypothetical protein